MGILAASLVRAVSWGCLVFLLLLCTGGLARLQVLPTTMCVNGVSREGPKISGGKAAEENVKIPPRTEGHVETEEQLLVLMAGMQSDFLMQLFV